MDRSLPRRWWYLAPAVGIGLYWLGSCQGKSSARDALVVQQAHATLDAGKPFHKALVRYQMIAQAASDTAREYRRRSDIRGRRITQLDTALLRAASRADSLGIALRQNLQLRGQVSDLQSANIALERAVLGATASTQLAVARADSLEVRLRSVLQVAECRWDLVVIHPRCPSRTSVAIVSLGVGVVGTLLVRR